MTARMQAAGHSAATLVAKRLRSVAISGRQDPQLVPAPIAAPTASTDSRSWESTASTIVFTPMPKQEQNVAPGLGRPAAG